MKRYLRPLTLALACLLLAAAGYAAASGDSLISLSYLQKTFFPQAVQAGEKAGNELLQDTYNKAKADLDAAHTGSGDTGSYSDTLQSRTWSDGQIITMKTGAGFLMLEGSATVIHTGAVVDITAGEEVASGAALAQNHRYLVWENTDAAVTVRSGEAVLGVQGGYSLTPGKNKHTPFYDVRQADWYYEPVGYVYERGLFSGMSAHQFSPGLTMNRAMLMSVLHRLAGAPEVTGGPVFTDVPDGRWYAQAVRWGAAQGITSGAGAGTFNHPGAGRGDDVQLRRQVHGPERWVGSGPVPFPGPGPGERVGQDGHELGGGERHHQRSEKRRRAHLGAQAQRHPGRDGHHAPGLLRENFIAERHPFPSEAI